MTQAGKAVLLAVCSAFFFTLESVVAKAVGGVPLGEGGVAPGAPIGEV